MSDDSARKEACREYQSSLEDLTFNSKPHINMLTILAEENIQFTKDIVAIIEAQIAKVFMKIDLFLFQSSCFSSSVATWLVEQRHDMRPVTWRQHGLFVERTLCNLTYILIFTLYLNVLFKFVTVQRVLLCKSRLDSAVYKSYSTPHFLIRPGKVHMFVGT